MFVMLICIKYATLLILRNSDVHRCEVNISRFRLLHSASNTNDYVEDCGGDSEVERVSEMSCQFLTVRSLLVEG